MSGLSLIAAMFFIGCAEKITNNRIDKLEVEESVLEKTTDLNKLKIELEKNMVRQQRLEDDVEGINQQASRSAREAEEMSTRLSRNPGDPGLAKRADRASKKAADDAKRASKLNRELNDVNEEIQKLRSDVDKTERDLNELRSRVEFVPNNQ